MRVTTMSERNGNSVGGRVRNTVKAYLNSEISFRRRCTEKLEKLSDIAVNSQNYREATEHFSTLLSLDPVSPIEILIKRSSARASMNSWEDALSDADEV